MLKTMTEALNDAHNYLLNIDESCFVMGEGVPDPKCIFGTTKGLQEKYPDRVFDMPVSENGGTGVCIGAALVGSRPIMIHQRIDFMMYAMDQIVNNAAKWYSMFGGQGGNCPLTIRCLIGRGWGQGNQHSQNLSYMFCGVPGLKVVAPSTAYNAKGLLIAAHRDNNPVIFIEHRWLHNTTSEVPDEGYEVEIGKARIAREGKHVTIATYGHSVIECLKASEFMAREGVDCEVIDLQTLSPFDIDTVVKSVKKTKRLLCVSEEHRLCSVLNSLALMAGSYVPIKIVMYNNPFFYPPSTPGLIKDYYPGILGIMENIQKLTLNTFDYDEAKKYVDSRAVDVPDQSFKGPF